MQSHTYKQIITRKHLTYMLTSTLTFPPGPHSAEMGPLCQGRVTNKRTHNGIAQESGYIFNRVTAGPLTALFYLFFFQMFLIELGLFCVPGVFLVIEFDFTCFSHCVRYFS